jgi:hypothetical protein
MSPPLSHPVRRQLENILTLTGISLALSVIVIFLTDNYATTWFRFALPLSILTTTYHAIILILPRLSPLLLHWSGGGGNPSEAPERSCPHVLMRPAIGLAGFLFVAWVAATSLMVVGLIEHYQGRWYRSLVADWAQLVLATLEMGVMLAIVIQSVRARMVAESEQEGGIQI